ncbi:VOC family protein [Actinomadura sp. HBU206391]|uniref:VOC family protein n=1 Tax=Actinomadura sp. HBU206391 TaxID=2731692 RepID=UPI00164F2ADB|nr:VOC family protein [Actinomadura sp. HBU206391]MBC6457304.1 VOC family protein [Actinomadura sp. HBU206391]
MTPTGPRTAPSWFDICSPDVARARRFYEEMFGWAMNVVAEEGYTLVGGEDGRPMGGIGQAGPSSPYTPGIVVYFQVDDLDTALARAEELGGERTLDPQALPGMGRMAVFNDPDGNAVGLLGP